MEAVLNGFGASLFQEEEDEIKKGFRLSLIRSKVSVCCNFLLAKFDHEVKKYYREQLSPNSCVDVEFVQHIMALLATKSIEVDGVPKSTVKNSINHLYADLKNLIGEDDDDF